jgi:ubiquinone/menaquinone biosynthesis C-methylase UbiE
MRNKVYAQVSALLPQGSRILDLACGTGTDAFWFAQHGYTVHGVDISDGMLRRAQEKAKRLGLESRAAFEHLSYTELGKLDKDQFDCTFSNFGGLNCVSDLRLVAEQVRPLLKRNARVIWALMPPFCLWESAMLLRGRFNLATRRFSGKSTVFKDFALKRPRLFEFLSKLDDALESKYPFKYWGDFTIVTLQHRA